MAKLKYECPQCGKILKLKNEFTIEGTKLFEYECGHLFAKDITVVDKSNLDFKSADLTDKHARPYQEDGVQFILESDFNCILGDQMRLGKTPQGLLALKNAYKERTPCLILVRSANLWQWIREYKVWCDTLPNGIFPVIGSNAWIPPGFSAYILSMDTFSRPKVLESLKKIPFKLIIADEAHSFKNTESNRSQALTEFVAFLNTGEVSKMLDFTCVRCQHQWEEEGKQKFDKRIGHVMIAKSTKCPECGQHCYQQQQHKESQDRKQDPISKPCGLILLTGTPILNRAEEYFVPLNLVNPEKFSSLESFRRTWLQQDSKGKWSRVKPGYIQAFKDVIKPYFLRREKEDVYKELPKLNKIYTVIEPDKSSLTSAYNKVLDKMETKIAAKANPTYFDLADDLMELRRICGLMKLMWTADYLEACTMETDAKYAIGIHHETVREVLYTKLGMDKNCYKLSGQDNAEQKDRIMREWEHSSRQFLIVNMLAGGVGMDFHYCDNVLVLERQWNSEVEAQFEFRFYNPDFSIKKNPTNVEYIIAKGTLDEWWYDMVEGKRLAVGETVYNNWNIQEDAVSFRDLAERTIAGRL
jgi:SNF2 family DNA or RNA helicase